MMKTKHTPGTWYVDKVNDGQWDVCVEREEDILVIASMTASFDNPSDNITNEDKANTLLIAASPELLEALQKAVDSLEWAAIVIGDMTPKCEYMECIKEAKAVMSKATGAQA